MQKAPPKLVATYQSTRRHIPEGRSLGFLNLFTRCPWDNHFRFLYSFTAVLNISECYKHTRRLLPAHLPRRTSPIKSVPSVSTDTTQCVTPSLHNNDKKLSGIIQIRVFIHHLLYVTTDDPSFVNRLTENKYLHTITYFWLNPFLFTARSTEKLGLHLREELDTFYLISKAPSPSPRPTQTLQNG